MSNENKVQQNKSAQTNNTTQTNQSKPAEQNDVIKFDKLSRLWELYNGIKVKDESAEIFGGPMDILKEFGKFLVEISDKEGLVSSGKKQSLLNEYNNMAALAGIEGKDQNLHVTTSSSISEIDTADRINKLVDSIVVSAPKEQNKEVRITIADDILQKTDVIIKNSGGEMLVQFTSDYANSISILSSQGAALQQLLESKSGMDVRLEVNAEEVVRKDNNSGGQSGREREQEHEEKENT
ncbi:MAG: type III secretion HpaP family protein [Desulfovibrionaceae bacterium]